MSKRDIQSLRSLTIAAARKGVIVQAAGDMVCIDSGRCVRAFPSVDSAAAFLLACGVL